MNMPLREEDDLCPICDTALEYHESGDYDEKLGEPRNRWVECQKCGYLREVV